MFIELQPFPVPNFQGCFCLPQKTRDERHQPTISRSNLTETLSLDVSNPIDVAMIVTTNHHLQVAL
jgi:hypothetical protein